MSTRTISVPKALVTDPALTPSAVRLYCILAAGKPGMSRHGAAVPIGDLARAVGLCGWSLTRRIKELETRGFIRVRRGRPGQVNRYTLLPGGRGSARKHSA